MPVMGKGVAVALTDHGRGGATGNGILGGGWTKPLSLSLPLPLLFSFYLFILCFSFLIYVFFHVG